jgi:hypothetical protein
MMNHGYRDYQEAYAYARQEAKTLGRPLALEKANHYGRTVYVVKGIPADPKNRYGWETRCQVVEPGE